MDIKQAIQTSFNLTDSIVNSYVGDLPPEALLARPVPGINHIAWQWGHLISAERALIEKAVPGAMGPLPEGFAARHAPATSSSDNPADFLDKSQYQAIAQQVRRETLALLERLTPDDFDKPAPNMIPTVKTVGDMFLFVSTHWLMHAGQWAVIRRGLGMPPLF